jgi:hypothetical protein
MQWIPNHLTCLQSCLPIQCPIGFSRLSYCSRAGSTFIITSHMLPVTSAYVFFVSFLSLSALSAHSRPPLTLNTTLKHLGLIDQFRVLPTCTKCWHMYPSTSAPDLKCSVCQIPIFWPIHGSGDNVESPILESRPLKVKPILVTPTWPISEQLKSFINQLGVEEALDAWWTWKHHSHKLMDISDGRIWNEIRGHDGQLFFENGSDKPDPDELCLTLTMNFDG